MKTKILIIGGLAGIVLSVLTAIIFHQRQSSHESITAPAAAKVEGTSRPAPSVQPGQATPSVAAVIQPSRDEAVPETNPEPTSSSAKPDAQPGADTGKKSKSGQKDPLTDPLARVALSLVGTDSEAEMYWIASINNPNLPPGERKDLIEDLNEEGLPDPKHPTVDDLPVLLSRLELIEEHWPWAMDQANDEAFDEAYKDLVNLIALVEGRGEPVK